MIRALSDIMSVFLQNPLTTSKLFLPDRRTATFTGVILTSCVLYRDRAYQRRSSNCCHSFRVGYSGKMWTFINCGICRQEKEETQFV